MKLVKDPVFVSVWFSASLPFVVAVDEEDGEEEETRTGFSSLLSNLRNPTMQIKNSVVY